MKCNRVRIKYENSRTARRYKYLIRQTVNAVLKSENASAPCMVDVTITDDAEIRLLNRRFMGKDRPTDVLSFPMQNMTAGKFEYDAGELDAQTGRLPLGDIVISMDRAKAQAKEYGHSVRREVAYLTVHSMLHLLGYDHMDEAEEKKLMRSREEFILERLGITRD